MEDFRESNHETEEGGGNVTVEEIKGAEAVFL